MKKNKNLSNKISFEEKISKSKEVGSLVIGGGIMSSTMTSQLTKYMHASNDILVLESLDNVGKESTNKVNNAGTFHLGLIEPNYTDEKAKNIYTGVLKSQAILMETLEKYPEEIQKKAIEKMKMATNRTPGETVITQDEYLMFKGNKIRHEKWLLNKGVNSINSSLFNPFENVTLEMLLPGDPGYSEEETKYVLRNEHYLAGGVDFGMVNQALFEAEKEYGEETGREGSFDLKTNCEVTDIEKEIVDGEEIFIVTYTDKETQEQHYIKTKSIFAGAGGYTLKLLEQAGANMDDDAIFTVGGAFLEVKLNNDKIIETISKMKSDYEKAIDFLENDQLFDEHEEKLVKIRGQIKELDNLVEKLNSDELFQKFIKGELLEEQEKNEIESLFREISNTIFKVYHFVKRYGPAGVDAPPMSVPHFDYRLSYDNKTGKYLPEASLLFGPYATATTEVLKHAKHTFFETFLGEKGKLNLSKIINYIKNPFEKAGLTKYLVIQSVITEMAEDGELNPKNPRNKLFLDEFFKFCPGIVDYVQNGNFILSKFEAGKRAQMIDHKGDIVTGTKAVRSEISSTKAYISGILGASPGASKASEIVSHIVRDMIIKSKPINDYIYFFNKIKCFKGVLEEHINENLLEAKNLKNIFTDENNSVLPIEIDYNNYNETRIKTLEEINKEYEFLKNKLKNNPEHRKDLESLELKINEKTLDFEYDDGGYQKSLDNIDNKIENDESRIELEKKVVKYFDFMSEKELKNNIEDVEEKRKRNTKNLIIDFYKELKNISLLEDNERKNYRIKYNEKDYRIMKVKNGKIHLTKKIKGDKRKNTEDRYENKIISVKEIFEKDTNINFYKKSEIEKDYENGKINKYKFSFGFINKAFGTNFESIKVGKNDIQDYDRKKSTKSEQDLRRLDEKIIFMKETYFKENLDLYPELDFSLER